MIPVAHAAAQRKIAACSSGGAKGVLPRRSVRAASPQRPPPIPPRGVAPAALAIRDRAPRCGTSLAIGDLEPRCSASAGDRAPQRGSSFAIGELGPRCSASAGDLGLGGNADDRAPQVGSSLAIREGGKRLRAGAGWVACLAAALGLTGCARCSGESSDASGVSGGGGAPASGGAALPAKVPAPSAWTLSTVRMPTGVAVPERCHQRAPLLVATVPITSHFAADPRTLGVLVVADTEPSPPAVLRSGELIFPGAGASTGGAAPPGAPAITGGAWVPWPDARSAPRLARTDGQWIGAWDVARKKASSEVRLYRGGSVTSLGVGDLFASADLACGPSRCALLTSRLGRVAPAGADVVLLAADPRVPPRTVTFEPEGDSAARPFGIAAVEGPRGAVVVLVDHGEALFWSPEATPGVIARLPAEHGVLEALLLGERPLVLAHGNVVDDKGCAREGSDIRGAKLRIVRGGEAPIDIATPGAPSLAALRPLGVGALALWVSPLGCGAERRVLYGLVLDANGAPAGEPLPIADAETFAAASSGPDADVWLRHDDKVFWLRMSCAP